MGNEKSSLSGLELDEKAIEVTDFWSHHSATVNSGNTVSVFIGEPLISGSLWLSQTPLEKTTKNLMIYRHPSILKYISSWQKGSKFYLAVEDVKPLSLVLPLQNVLQICIGLHAILKALIFLHETARVSHNNVCIASIYVTKDGNWRLGGMEYLCRFIDLNEDYLCKTRTHRYNKCIDANESKTSKERSETQYAIDCYAFGVLVNEILCSQNTNDVPSVVAFRDFCKTNLQNSEVSKRSKLSSLLEHPFFTHDFINIHSFLTELPLKMDEVKILFFSSLVKKLKSFEETLIAIQLGGLLLSRMVLLDKTARQELLPYVLCPRKNNDESSEALFSTDNFKKYIIPKLLQIFCVRDAQIRLLLLEYFIQYVHCFSIDELQTHILPELLVGIKDTNDHLVSVTLRALADIVPILGAATVIGGKRAKLFNDGRPVAHLSKRPSRRNSKRATDNTSNPLTSTSTDATLDSASNTIIELNHELELPERPSPDGEEGETSTEDVEHSPEDDLENWEDWEINDENHGDRILSNTNNVVSNVASDIPNEDVNLTNTLSTLALKEDISTSEDLLQAPENTTATLVTNSNKKVVQQNNKSLPNILELDIKNQRGRNALNEDFDFFQDMEPVIQSPIIYQLPNNNNDEIISNNPQSYSRKFDFNVADVEKQEEGWGDDLDW